MAEVSASMVKELREKTGAGMLDCKNALAEASGDMEKATEFLRKKGIASADKKSGRLASEGLINVFHSGDIASIVEVNCETDFVAKNEDFQNFLKHLNQHIAKNFPQDLEALKTQPLLDTGKTVDLANKELVAKIGENISIRRFKAFRASPGEKVGSYTHMGSKIGAIVLIASTSPKVNEEVAKDVAMHIAAVSPRFLTREEIPEEVRLKEKEIYLAQLQDSGKPAEMLEKIVEGKLGKFASEVCLIDQIFIKDPQGKLSVQKFLTGLDPEAKVVGFVRFQVGEGLAKREEDFAAEVAKQLQK